MQVDEMEKPRVTQCKGEGQGWCDRCEKLKGWNRMWMCFLYQIEGYDGTYCRECVQEILKESAKLE